MRALRAAGRAARTWACATRPATTARAERQAARSAVQESSCGKIVSRSAWSDQQAKLAYGLGHGGFGRLARMRQIDRHDLAHPPWARRQHDHAIGQHDGLL